MPKRTPAQIPLNVVDFSKGNHDGSIQIKPPAPPLAYIGKRPTAANYSDELKQAGQDMSACYQLIEDAWKTAEARLALAHVPTEVRVKVFDSEDDNEHGSNGYIDVVYLAYTRYKGEWRICVIDSSYQMQTEEESETCRAITECPVDRRLAMFDWFDKLHTEVLKTTREYVPKVKERVAKFLAALETPDQTS